MAREVAEAAVKAFYERGVRDTETRLTEEVAMVCRDYCTESWGVTMDRTGVPADSELRRAENIFFQRIFKRFLIRTLLPRSSFPPRPPFLTTTFLGVEEWTRRLNHRPRISHPRTPSQSGMSSRRPRMLNLNQKLKVLILRLLIPRKIPLRTRPRIIDVGFSFVTLFLFSIPLPFATAYNVNFP